MQVKLADLTIRIENRFPFLEEKCRRYMAEAETPDFTIAVNEAELMAEEAANTNPGYAESLAVYRKIAEEILLHDGFLMHGAVVETNGEGVAFLAKSGVGKTTHMALWKKYLGDNLQVVNGDKPLIRFFDGVPYAYGTPWAGKEGLERNTCVPLKAKCFLSRGTENETVPVKKEEAFMQLLPQLYTPKDGAKMGALLDLVGRLIEKVSFYSIRCTMDPEAAEIAYKAIFN